MKLRLPTVRRIKLQPQPIEVTDELTGAIANDTRDHDNNWDLTEFADSESVVRFWESFDNKTK